MLLESPPPIVSVAREAIEPSYAEMTATHDARMLAPPQFALVSRSSIAIEKRESQFSRRYFECLKT